MSLNGCVCVCVCVYWTGFEFFSVSRMLCVFHLEGGEQLSHTDKPQTRGVEVQNEVSVAIKPILLLLSITAVGPLHSHPGETLASGQMACPISNHHEFSCRRQIINLQTYCLLISYSIRISPEDKNMIFPPGKNHWHLLRFSKVLTRARDCPTV